MTPDELLGLVWCVELGGSDKEPDELLGLVRCVEMGRRDKEPDELLGLVWRVDMAYNRCDMMCEGWSWRKRHQTSYWGSSGVRRRRVRMKRPDEHLSLVWACERTSFPPVSYCEH